MSRIVGDQTEGLCAHVVAPGDWTLGVTSHTPPHVKSTFSEDKTDEQKCG